MKKMMSHNEVFAIRDGESTVILESPPESGRWLAVMLRSVEMPPGEFYPSRHIDGAPVEKAAVLAAQKNMDGLWQWVYLSAPTKETIGDLLIDSGAEPDRWYYAKIEYLPK